jgi:hypothetical protein
MGSYLILLFICLIAFLVPVGIFGFLTVAFSAYFLQGIARLIGVENKEFDDAYNMAFKTSKITAIVVLIPGFVSCILISLFYPDLWNNAVKLILAFTCGGVPGIVFSFFIITKKYDIKNPKKAFMITLPVWIVQTIMLSLFFYAQVQITFSILKFLQNPISG